MKLFSYVCSQKIVTLTLLIWVMIPSQINVFVWCKVDITGYRYAVVQVSFVEENSFSFLMKSFSYLCLKSINWKWKSLSRVQVFATLWTVQSMEFSRPEYWSRKPFPSPGGSFQPGDQTWVSHIAGRFFTSWAIREDQLKIN